MHGFDLSAGIAYTDATFTTTNATIRTLKGATLPNVPRWTVNLEGNYRWSLTAGTDAYLHGDYQYAGHRYSDLPLSTTNVDQPGYGIVNLRAGLSHGPWDVSLFVKNVADTRAILYTAISSGLNYVSINTPRTIGAEISLRF